MPESLIAIPNVALPNTRLGLGGKRGFALVLLKKELVEKLGWANIESILINCGRSKNEIRFLKVA